MLLAIEDLDCGLLNLRLVCLLWVIIVFSRYAEQIPIWICTLVKTISRILMVQVIWRLVFLRMNGGHCISPESRIVAKRSLEVYLRVWFL